MNLESTVREVLSGELVWKSHYQQHGRLQQLADRLQKALRMSDADQIYVSARHFAWEVMEHMKEEESATGIYSRIANLDRRFDSPLKKLRAQHKEILNMLNAICSEVDENLPTVVIFIRDCLDTVARHEKDEEQLFREVLSDLTPS